MRKEEERGDQLLKGELVFNGEKKVTYLFQKAYKDTKDLVIVFSGIPPVRTEPKYNYIKTLQGFDCNKLFILDDFGSDFGSRASYYICENRNYSIERSVISLIKKVIKENNIKNIVAAGSSKGGFAALYFGIKYGFNHVIAGSPQFNLGEYLLNRTNSQKISEYMVGGSKHEDLEYLNRILPNVITESNHKPFISLYVGKGEYHYEGHVKPLTKLLKEKNIPYKIELGDFNSHEHLSTYFPSILIKNVSETLKYPIIESINQTEINNNEEICFETKIINGKNIKVAWYLYQDGKKIITKNYSSETKFTAKLTSPGKYFVKAFVINDLNHRYSLVGKPFVMKL
jgi:hypothetical protein